MSPLIIPPLSILKNSDSHPDLSAKTRLLCEPDANSNSSSTSSSSNTSYSSCFDESPNESPKFENIVRCKSCPTNSINESFGYKSLAILSDHVGSVSCIALCGEFVLSASQGKDVIVWQQPDLKQFTRFGEGDGSVKALLAVGNKVFTAHQDSRIRVWKVSQRSENVLRLVDTLPTTKDYLGKFMKQSNYIPTRRSHRRLWIEHSDSISSLAVHNGYIYSGSWDKTIKVWRLSDLKCLESIKAHDDAINSLAASKGIVYSSSADGKIKAWCRDHKTERHVLKGVLEGNKDVSFNSVVVLSNGKMVFGGGSDGYVMCWEANGDDFSNWKLVFKLKAHQMAVLCLCLISDELLCSGSADKSIIIWRIEQGCQKGLRKVGVMNGHEGPVKCLQASGGSVGDGVMLYSGSLDRTMRVWWVPKKSSNLSVIHKIASI